jgi:hypothetical protein
MSFLMAAAPDTIAVDDLSAIAIRETHWGFAVIEARPDATADLISTVLGRIAGAALLLAALALWVLPGADRGADLIPMKLALTASLLAAGIALIWHARHEWRPELQVDATHREIRMALRSMFGDIRTLTRLRMREIDECFIRPSRELDGYSDLCFRVLGSDSPLRLATAPVEQLRPVLERLTRDLRTPRERIELRIAS